MITFRGLLNHASSIKLTDCYGSPAHRHLDLTQNLVRSLSSEHKTGFSSVTALRKQSVTACSHVLHSAKWLLSLGTVRMMCRFAMCTMGMALEQFQAVGVSTAVKEIKELSTADADSSTPVTSALWVPLRRSRDVCEALGHLPAATEEPWISSWESWRGQGGRWCAAVAGLGMGSEGERWVSSGTKGHWTQEPPLHTVRRDFPIPSSLLICSPLSLGMHLLPFSSHAPSGGQALGEGGLYTEVGISGVLCIDGHCPSTLSGWMAQSMFLHATSSSARGMSVSNLYRCLYMYNLASLIFLTKAQEFL